MSHNTTDPKVLKAVFPSFVEFEFLAKGGFKLVFKATRASGECEVLKIILLPEQDGTDDAKALHEQALARATREVTLLKECDSPFVVKLGSLAPAITDIGGTQCVAYTEELLPGQDLWKIIQTKYRATEAECRELVWCLSKAVQQIWNQHGLVHRDIKPLNVFATGQGDRPYVLLDFGIAYNVREPQLTFSNQSAPMTRRYKAPEMADPQFRETLDYRTDLYTIGMTAFEYATGGVWPFDPKTGEDPQKTITRILTMEPRRLREERPDFSEDFCDLMDSFLSKKRSLRLANFNMIFKRLES